ncbi:MAG: hypothetical protein GC159_00770, partial [Phycisphaera sp.]|nr:hypothetical protein [Phycisphaera sp.]
GDIDVLSAEDYDNEIAWYENDGSQSFTPHSISTAASGATSVFAADVDSDGDLDVLSASRNDDKIAWYENLGYDFGDAPSPYPTTLAEDGARHAVTGPTLGGSRDEERDGVHSINADADDLSGDTPDDETGVTFTSVITPGMQDATVSVVVSGGPAKLDAWIDFNGNGTFDVATERIFNSVDVADGTNDLTFDVPADALPGATYARFRLSTAGVAAPYGAAPDGEVEDYAVTVSNPGGTGLFVDGGTTANTLFATDLAVGDLNGDGAVDLFVTHVDDEDEIWLNNGSGVFTVSQSLPVGASRDVVLGDLDSDGDLDAYVIHDDEGNRVWLNDGSGFFTDTGQSLGTYSSLSVTIGDIDGDGDLDVVTGVFDAANHVWLNDGTGFFTDSGQMLGNERTLDVELGDVDGDGDLDLVETCNQAPNRVWLNDGTGVFTDSGQALGTGPTSRSVRLGDVDGDGDLDAVIASYPNSGVWLNDGSGVFTDTGQVLEAGVTPVFDLGDLDGDGDLDLFSVAASGAAGNAWINQGSAQNGTQGVFLTNGQTLPLIAQAQAVELADVDADGDLDALTLGNGDPGRVVLNDNPPVVADQMFDIAEGSAMDASVGAVVASDADTPSPLTFAITGGTGASVFDIDSATGELTVLDPVAIDFDVNTGFTLVVSVTDSVGVAASATMTIDVTNVAPSTPTDADGATNEVSEDATNGTPVGITASSTDPVSGDVFYMLSDDAGGRFQIDESTGVVTVLDGSLLDFDDVTSHMITVRARDTAGLFDEATFTIDVTNAAPSTPIDSDGAANEVSEDATNGTPVGITASASDPVSGDVTYTLSDDAGGAFVIDGDTGVVTLADGSLLNFALANSFDITVRATDPQGAFSEETFSIDVLRAFDLDVDGNGTALPLTDGILLIRFLAGFTGNVLTDGALAGDATRTDPVEILAYLEAAATRFLDVDANGSTLPLTDGILLIRFLAGFTGGVLTDGALAGDATRSDPAEIIAFLSMFQPADPPPPLVIEETPTEPAPLLAADAEPGPTGDAGPPLSALGLVDLLADRDDPQLFADAFANPKVSDGRLRRLLQLDLTPHALSLRDEALTDAVQIIGLV